MAINTESAQFQRSLWHGLVVFLRDVAVILVVAIVVSFLIKTFLLRSFYIPSSSMMNTLEEDDRILVNQLVPNLVGLERGDVVVFSDPGGWLTAQPKKDVPPLQAFTDGVLSIVGLAAPDSEDHLVKRVIGLPGDHVVCCNAQGQITINDVPVAEPFILLPAGETRASGMPFDVVVPPDHLWVMGDNRYNSRDSRFNMETPTKGFVPIENLVGRAFVISWPVENWSWLSNYHSSFQAVPDP